MKNLTWLFALLIILISGANLAYSQTQDGTSTPNFEAPVFWVKYWNIPSYVDDGDGDFSNDKRSGISHDGDVLINPHRDGERVFFTIENDYYAGKVFYYERSKLSTDPRKTNWWLAMVQDWDEHGTLWEAVGQATLANERYADRTHPFVKEHPQVIWAVIHHMMDLKLVDPGEFEKMSPKRVREVMVQYTELATGPLKAQH